MTHDDISQVEAPTELGQLIAAVARIEAIVLPLQTELTQLGQQLSAHLEGCSIRHKDLDMGGLRESNRLDRIEAIMAEYAKDFSRHGRDHTELEARTRALEDSRLKLETTTTLWARLWPVILTALSSGGAVAALSHLRLLGQ